MDNMTIGLMNVDVVVGRRQDGEHPNDDTWSSCVHSMLTPRGSLISEADVRRTDESYGA
jgi:hypothetical protein